MKKLLWLAMLLPSLAWAAAGDLILMQRNPGNTSYIERVFPLESAISTTLASYRSAIGLGTEDTPSFTGLMLASGGLIRPSAGNLSVQAVSGSSLFLGTTAGTQLSIFNGGVTLASGTTLGFTDAAQITGGAGNMTITAGTGNSRTLAFQTTTSGGTATNGLTIDATQNVAFPGPASGNNRITLQASGADPFIWYRVTGGGGGEWSVGPDTSDTNSFVWVNGSSLSGTNMMRLTTGGNLSTAGHMQGIGGGIFRGSPVGDTGTTNVEIGVSSGVGHVGAFLRGTGAAPMVLQLNGGLLGMSVTSTATAAGTTTITSASTPVQVFTGSTTQNVTLPAANVLGAGRGVLLLFKNRSSGTVTINRAGSDTIDGSTSYSLTAGSAVTLISDGSSEWTVN